jgi:site-specific DNA recombinase
MRVAVYARYSSDLQDARSIEDQLTLARDHADRQGWPVVAEFKDAAISGASLHNRPGLLDLMQAAQAGQFDAVLTESLDRLSRDLEDIAGLYKRLDYWGIEIITLADGKVGKLHVGLKGIIASIYLDDLAQKTRRGQAGRVRAGRIPGGRCYGYDVLRDSEEGGKRAINDVEASVVRRIFREYVSGYSPLKIVSRLNTEGVPGPRGGPWNASALLGSAKRRNGLLNNSLYAGRITYNRQRFVKDPETGKRQARANPPDQWITKDVPDLVIISPDLWQAAQDRRAALTRKHLLHCRRPKHLLSGLLTCGNCGGQMIVRNRRGRTTYFGCSARINRMGCANARSVTSTEIESRVLAALRAHLLVPEVISEAVEAYRTERRRLSDEAARSRGLAERELAEIERKIASLVKEIESGRGSKSVSQGLLELEGEQETVEARLTMANVPDVVVLHPSAAERYRQKVEDIQATLTAGDAAGVEAVALVRELIQRVRVVPTARGEPVGLEIAGDLAALLTVNEKGTSSMASLVAGVGFEPTSGLAPDLDPPPCQRTNIIGRKLDRHNNNIRVHCFILLGSPMISMGCAAGEANSQRTSDRSPQGRPTIEAQHANFAAAQATATLAQSSRTAHRQADFDGLARDAPCWIS